ncbi:hypothetical protein [Heyndrickxia coagulans]|uniref:hypothetical protein n=1 Tax=Heyndrickxia coagulans TaxID=1398 RepID=UPI003F684EEF
MTGKPSLLSSLQPTSSKSIITLADGSKSRALGSGTVSPTSCLPLSSILHVPNLSFNLLSVSKFAHDLNCSVSFFPDYCLFQDLVTKWTIGRGRESGGLYVLNHSPSSSTACLGVANPFELHCCLGHPSLSLLKRLYPPSVFKNHGT